MFWDHRGGVFIGNNVFIGMHTTILKGVHIGNNVIIGANSLVNKNVPDNCVVAGNPARAIMSLDEYHEKRKLAQEKEAIELVKLYREQYGKDPDEKAMHEFFWLFSDDPEDLPVCWKSVNALCGNKELTETLMRQNQKKYDSFEAFLRSV